MVSKLLKYTLSQKPNLYYDFGNLLLPQNILYWDYGKFTVKGFISYDGI